MADLQVEATLRDKTKAGITKLQRQIERAHNKANALRNRERAAVEKAHNRSNQIRTKEKISLEKAHVRANQMRAREKAAVEKAHLRSNKLLEKESRQRKMQWAKWGAAIAAAAVVAAAAIARIGAKLFTLASNAEEVDNVLNLAFGSMSQDVEDWAATFAKATGTSRFEAREMVGDLGLIIKGMGFGSQATFDMSTRMTELARDMASAKNVKFEDALTKIRAGLLGEAEPLRVMGVALTAARVKEEAYASGIAKRGEELTEANKVEARMQIILADSIAMHGDAANTLDSSANQWVTIKAVIRDNATMLGQFFMPVFQKVLGFIRDGVNVSIDFAKKLYASSQETNRWTTFLGNVTTILGVVWNVLKPLVYALERQFRVGDQEPCHAGHRLAWWTSSTRSLPISRPATTGSPVSSQVWRKWPQRQPRPAMPGIPSLTI